MVLTWQSFKIVRMAKSKVWNPFSIWYDLFQYTIVAVYILSVLQRALDSCAQIIFRVFRWAQQARAATSFFYTRARGAHCRIGLAIG